MCSLYQYIFHQYYFKQAQQISIQASMTQQISIQASMTQCLSNQAQIQQYLCNMHLYYCILSKGFQIQKPQSIIQTQSVMGAAKSITHSFAANEYLYWHIERNQIDKIQALLSSNPGLLNSSLTVNIKTTPLHRVASTGNIRLLSLFVEKHQANINYQTSTGETPLIGSVKRDQLQVAEYLLKRGALTQTVTNAGMRAIDYAILRGFYEMALLIYKNTENKQLKDSFEYYSMTRQYHTRYVNFDVFLDALQKQIAPNSVSNFLKKTKKRLQDPVADPNQSWKHWLSRQINFQDPPLVERSTLPQHLQPQNRNFARLRFNLTKWMSSPLSQEMYLQPREVSETGTEVKMKKDNVFMVEEMYTEQIQVRTAS